MLHPECLTESQAGNTYAGRDLSQSWSDLALWDEFLNRFPVEAIVDLQESSGGIDLFLSHQCLGRQISFALVGSSGTSPDLRDEVREAGGRVATQNLDAQETVALVTTLLPKNAHPLILVCHEGDRRCDFARFSEMLQSGDFFVVHDWSRGTEVPSAALTKVWPPHGTECSIRWFAVSA